MQTIQTIQNFRFILFLTDLYSCGSDAFLDATSHLYKRLCPSVRRSVRPSVPSYFRTTNMANFECEKSSTDIINNGTMSVDEVVASDVPPRYLLFCGRNLSVCRRYCILRQFYHWRSSHYSQNPRSHSSYIATGAPLSRP